MCDVFESYLYCYSNCCFLFWICLASAARWLDIPLDGGQPQHALHWNDCVARRAACVGQHSNGNSNISSNIYIYIYMRMCIHRHPWAGPWPRGNP